MKSQELSSLNISKLEYIDSGDGTCIIKKYNDDGNGDLIIPSKINGLTVVEIGDYAFEGCGGFEGSLAIPNDVIRIGEHAFSEVWFEGDLIIPNSVKTIGKGAFYSCYTYTWDNYIGCLAIPEGVINIEECAFSECDFIGDLIIPDSVTNIGAGAFHECSFTGRLKLPSGLTVIEPCAFIGCSGFKGCLTIPDSVTSIGENAFYCCRNFSGFLIIPNTVTSIGKDAFYGCEGFDEIIWGDRKINKKIDKKGGFCYTLWEF